MRGNRALSLYLRLRAVADRLAPRRLGQPDTNGDPDPRAPERLGQADRPRPKGTLIWATGTDQGQIMAVLALMPRLELERAEAVTTLVTTQDDKIARHLPHGMIHQLEPHDGVQSVQRFLDHWMPDLVIMSGVDLPVAAATLASERDIPLVWTDAELPRQGTNLLPRLDRSLPLRFSRIFTTSGEAVSALSEIGVTSQSLARVGPLREDGVALPCDEAERDRIAQTLAGRTVWMAVSATADDIDMIDSAHRHVSRRAHRMLLIVLPASGADADALSTALAERGWDLLRRSEEATPGTETQVFVADIEGEDGLWYRLAPLSFLAGTFSDDRAPRNPFEAAALGSAIIHGPFLEPHQARFDRLSRAQATRVLQSQAALGPALESLLAPDRTAMMAAAAWRVISEGAEASDTVVNALTGLLDEVDATR